VHFIEHRLVGALATVRIAGGSRDGSWRPYGAQSEFSWDLQAMSMRYSGLLGDNDI
jgi:hypothetical protein